MQYVVMNQLGQAQEILYHEDPLFPGIPLEGRYSKQFLDHCLIVPDAVEVMIGYLWDSESSEFAAPPEPEPAPPSPEPEPAPTPGMPSPEEDRDALLVDLDYRTTILELGVM